MSNRRRPTNVVPLNGGRPVNPLLVRGLAGVDWTDEPAADYSREVLSWIVANVPTIGRMNVWVCEACGTQVLCVDRHPGVTPFMVSHHTLGNPDCGGSCQSRFYNGAIAAEVHARVGRPSHEWYRPSADQLEAETPYVRDHVLRGGLLVREVAS